MRTKPAVIAVYKLRTVSHVAGERRALIHVTAIK